MIEASNTESKLPNMLDSEIEAIDDAAEVLLHGTSGVDFDEDELEADQIRLRRLGQEKYRNNKVSGLERIFCDSGIEFNGK